MMRAVWLLLALSGCSVAYSAAAVPAQFEEPLRFSDEPFVENPRFCIGGGGNACRVQPIPC